VALRDGVEDGGSCRYAESRGCRGS
jgi:hypothetical protein